MTLIIHEKNVIILSPVSLKCIGNVAFELLKQRFVPPKFKIKFLGKVIILMTYLR